MSSRLARSAHILDAGNGVMTQKLKARFEQKFLLKRITDLHWPGDLRAIGRSIHAKQKLPRQGHRAPSPRRHKKLDCQPRSRYRGQLFMT